MFCTKWLAVAFNGSAKATKKKVAEKTLLAKMLMLSRYNVYHVLHLSMLIFAN